MKAIVLSANCLVNGPFNSFWSVEKYTQEIID